MAAKLPVYLSVNGTPDGTLPDGRQNFVPADPRFGFALIATPTGFSIYNGGILSLRKNFARHYSVLANYTYSKSIDIATDVQLTSTPQDYLDPERATAPSATTTFVTALFFRSWPTVRRSGRRCCATSRYRC